MASLTITRKDIQDLNWWDVDDLFDLVRNEYRDRFETYVFKNYADDIIADMNDYKLIEECENRGFTIDENYDLSDVHVDDLLEELENRGYHVTYRRAKIRKINQTQ